MKRLNAYVQQGFTIVETVITISIFMVILLAFFNLYSHYNNVFNSQQAISKVAGSATLAMSDMQNYILQADQVASSHTFSSTVYTSGANTLVLELPAINSSGDIVTEKFDYVAFYTSGAKLYRLLSTDAASNRSPGLKQLSDSLSSLVFTYDNATINQSDKVDIDIQTQAQLKPQPMQYRLKQQIYLRNK